MPAPPTTNIHACVGNSQVENLKSPIILWDKAQLDSNSVEKFDPNICSLETWMNQLFSAEPTG